MRPVRPDSFDGTMDLLKVNTWLYLMLQYFALVQATTNAAHEEQDKIFFASTQLQNSAAVWWYTLQMGNTIPRDWQAFENAARPAFIPQDNVRRARDHLRKCRENRKVSEYMASFRNAALHVANISENEKWDRFGGRFQAGDCV